MDKTPFEILAETPLSALSPTFRAFNARIWELETCLNQELSAPIWNTAKAQKRIEALETTAMKRVAAETSPVGKTGKAPIPGIVESVADKKPELSGRELFAASVKIHGQSNATTKLRSHLKGRAKFAAAVRISTT